MDDDDQRIGVAEKAAAHRWPGALHRAFSVFLIDERGRLLLQRRAETTHHFRGLWSNSCCSHPLPGETVSAAARRRVGEELGLYDSSPGPVGRFRYSACDPVTGLAEHELDHVLTGPGLADPVPDPTEVDDWCWLTPLEVRTRLATSPEAFTPWFRPALDLACPDWPTATAFPFPAPNQPARSSSAVPPTPSLPRHQGPATGGKKVFND